MTESLTDTCIRLEHFETPAWCIDALLEKEMLTQWVIDPCAGTGIIGKLVRAAGSYTLEIDIHDYGCQTLDMVRDFFSEPTPLIEGNTVMMNPPFSLAQRFVESAFEQGARKVICFQRFAWWESDGRRSFWQKYPPNRIYICGDRAHCWRHDIPEQHRKYHPVTGKKRSGTPTAHAWFVWERGHPPGPLLGHIYKGDAHAK